LRIVNAIIKQKTKKAGNKVNLYHLRYFVTLAHLEHYTKASKELMITQPSLSHAISSLEEELGIPLFEKDGRNIVLTKSGRMFLAEVEKSLVILDEGIKNLKMSSTGEGRIDLGLLRTLGTDYIPRIIRDFMEKHKDKAIEFHFHTGVSVDLIQGLKDKKYDIVFCSKLDSEPGIEFIHMAKQDLVMIVPLDHPLAEKDSVDLSDTIPYPQIVFSEKSGLSPVIEGLFRQIGARPQVAYEVEEDEVVAGLVSNGFGIAVCPNMPILSSMSLKVLQLTSPKWERNFYVAMLNDRYVPPIVNELKDFVAVDSKKK